MNHTRSWRQGDPIEKANRALRVAAQMTIHAANCKKYPLVQDEVGFFHRTVRTGGVLCRRLIREPRSWTHDRRRFTVLRGCSICRAMWESIQHEKKREKRRGK